MNTIKQAYREVEQFRLILQQEQRYTSMQESILAETTGVDGKDKANIARVCLFLSIAL